MSHTTAYFRAASLLGLLLTGAGCSAPPIGPELCRRPATDEPLAYRGGDVDNGVYMSAEWDGELLFFPGGAFYRIEHQLGEVPRWWQFYLSFDRQLEFEGGGGQGDVSDRFESGSLALAAGNQAELRGISDEAITVLNASCVDYYILAVAGASAQQP